MSVCTRAAVLLMLTGFCGWLVTGVPGWFGVSLSVAAGIIVLSPLIGGNRMDRKVEPITSFTPDVAGRCAFQAWRRAVSYTPAWDWADMSAREKAAWIAHATAPGYQSGTQPARMTA